MPNKHSIVVSDSTSSPFDQIQLGNGRWSARDLMSLAGYSTWQHFDVPLKRAMRAAENQGYNVTSHFTESRKMVKRPQGGGLEQADYELTRFAAYLVAMNGDPNKPEIAAAQAYFAVKTREAEVKHDPDPDGSIRRQEMRDYRTILNSLKQGGVTESKDYARVQNSLYRGLFGQTARDLRSSRPRLWGHRKKPEISTPKEKTPPKTT